MDTTLDFEARRKFWSPSPPSLPKRESPPSPRLPPNFAVFLVIPCPPSKRGSCLISLLNPTRESPNPRIWLHSHRVQVRRCGGAQSHVQNRYQDRVHGRVPLLKTFESMMFT
ncbi:hypothetical protein CEXT_770931 [Caerostris extrusa]|uniref:Uncharacterized protein n=1 Tax=Caerostris extrusa TaxID=172846 RepID=A0AAV4P1T8_CAEEX|nr:hypothetical protein CEXT_770931 [Caerostris extrusa]